MSSEHNNNIYKRLPENKTSTIIVLFSDSLNIIHLSILSTVVFLPEFVFSNSLELSIYFLYSSKSYRRKKFKQILNRTGILLVH